jgi:hypothetical protein
MVKNSIDFAPVLVPYCPKALEITAFLLLKRFIAIKQKRNSQHDRCFGPGRNFGLGTQAVRIVSQWKTYSYFPNVSPVLDRQLDKVQLFPPYRRSSSSRR